MNYTELTAAIQDGCEFAESSFIDHIPDFVRRAEERILRDVDLPAFQQTDTTSVDSGVRFLTTPDGYLYAQYLIVNGRVLLNKQVDFIAECYPTGTSPAAPIYYAQWDEDSLLLGPTPDDDYDAELRYTRLPESIVDAGTSWLGDNAHRSLLYAALVEAAIYMRQDESVIMAFEQSYQDALKGLALYGTLRVKKDEFKERDKRPNDKRE